VSTRSAMLRVVPADLAEWRRAASRYGYADEYALIRAAVAAYCSAPSQAVRDQVLGATIRELVSAQR
jgi:hypothetical protein